MKIIRPFKVSDASLVSCNVEERDYDRWSSTATYASGDTTLLANPASNVTMTIASPCVVTWPKHNLAVSDAVVFRTTGALPTGLTVNKPYYLATSIPLSVLTTVAVGLNPEYGVYCPTNDRVYVCNAGATTVSVIRPSDNTVVTTVTVGAGPIDAIYCPTNDRVYVCNGSATTVSVIRPSDNTVVNTITVGTSPYAGCYCPTNDRLYIANYVTNNVSVINPSTDTVVATITVGTSPISTVYCPTNDRVYVVNNNASSNSLSVINPSTNIVVATITVGVNPYHITYCPTNDRLYVANFNTDDVSVVNPSTNTVVATITVGTEPVSSAYCPTTDRVYIVNRNTNNISIIRPSDNTVVGTLSIGTTPYGLIYCPTYDRFYGVNAGSANVSVIELDGSFTVSATEGGAAINTSGTQSGTHSSQAFISPVSSKVTISKTSPAVIGWSSHGFSDDDEVTLYATGTLPTGFTANKPYYITRSATNTFQLTDVPGGASIAATTDGSGVFFCVAKHHKLYESLVDTNLNYPPHKNPTKWFGVSSDNRWKMFDTSVTSQTKNFDNITCNFKVTGRVDSLALMNVTASSVTITGTDAVAGVVYGPTTYSLSDSSGIGDWWTYFFEPIVFKKDWVDIDFPPYNDLLLTVVVADTGKTVGVGAMILGLSKTLGTSQYGASVGILDYSIKQRDTFGDYTVLERAFSKRNRFTLWIDASLVDSVVTALAQYRAIPCVYVGVETYQSTIIYGFYKDFNVDISYPTMSICSIDIEGLT